MLGGLAVPLQLMAPTLVIKNLQSHQESEMWVEVKGLYGQI